MHIHTASRAEGGGGARMAVSSTHRAPGDRGDPTPDSASGRERSPL